MEYFSVLVDLIYRAKSDKRRFNVQIDVSEVQDLSIDSIMYLIAVVFNIVRECNNIDLTGNLPNNSDARDLMIEAGFDKFVNFKGRIVPAPKIEGNAIKISSGGSINTDKAKQIIDFVVNKTGRKRCQFSFLYEMLIELMANVNEHAYDSKVKNSPLSTWYCYVKFEYSKVKFIFLDTGFGIPATVLKKFLENINPFLSESKIIRSALNGDFRTKTGLEFRGKGLPGIMAKHRSGQIQELQIISGSGKVRNEGTNPVDEDTSSKLKGTLYAWSIVF